LTLRRIQTLGVWENIYLNVYSRDENSKGTGASKSLAGIEPFPGGREFPVFLRDSREEEERETLLS
jgi:hypothetical protein